VKCRTEEGLRKVQPLLVSPLTFSVFEFTRKKGLKCTLTLLPKCSDRCAVFKLEATRRPIFFFTSFLSVMKEGKNWFDCLNLMNWLGLLGLPSCKFRQLKLFFYSFESSSSNEWSFERRSVCLPFFGFQNCFAQLCPSAGLSLVLSLQNWEQRTDG
jgi:hypothetical protein